MILSHKDCFNLGHIAKSKGFKGELSLFLDVDEPENYQELDRILVDLNGVLTPFFIDVFRLKNDGYADIKLEGVETKDDSVRLSGKRVYLPLTDLPPLPGDEYYLHDLEGMEVIDESHGNLGMVLKVLDYSNNPLLEVNDGKAEVLIPINDLFVKKVDKAKKQILVDLPEGLVDVNK
ncbi:ribosome maturation factor RimM [Cryomorphaceae bacterium 1068]|nr:ribosome maturation factor RimM [Cryomorphaceae bacterium 1068]